MSKYNFKIGDVVKCVNVNKFYSGITREKHYVVVEVDEYTINIIDDFLLEKPYSKYCFEIDLKANRDSIIDNILDEN